MIDAVVNEIIKALDEADREAVNRAYRHTVRVDPDKIITMAAEAMRRTLLKELPGTIVEDSKLRALVTGPVHKRLEKTAFEAEYSIKKADPSQETPVVTGGGQKPLIVKFKFGGYGEKGKGSSAKDGSTSTFNVMTVVMGTIQSMILRDCVQKLNAELGSSISGSRASKADILGTAGDTQDNIRMGQLHGSPGNPTTIAAVGGAEKIKDRDVSAAHGSLTDDKRLVDIGKKVAKPNDLFDNIYEDYKKAFLKKVKLDNMADLDINTMRKQIDIEIEFDPMDKNAYMKDFDKRLLKTFIRNHTSAFIDELTEGLSDDQKQGSRSPRQHARAVAAKHAIVNLLGFAHKSNPDMRLKINKKLLNESRDYKKKDKKSFKVGKRVSPSQAIVAAKAIKTTRLKKRGQGKVDGVAGTNPLALKTLLNDVLPQAVAAKMQAPALRFRTGRLANSAEVTDVLVGPRGGLQSIDYTYQRDPYETYEPGNKRGSVQRDPRKLIGGTIREIAIGIVGKKFIPTRRV